MQCGTLDWLHSEIKYLSAVLPIIAIIFWELDLKLYPSTLLKRTAVSVQFKVDIFCKRLKKYTKVLRPTPNRDFTVALSSVLPCTKKSLLIRSDYL